MPTNHTPGPWLPGIHTVTVASTVTRPHRATVATAWGRDAGIPETEREANARLIAAAPDLLAALQVIALDPRIVAALEPFDPMALRQVRRAIALATGEEVPT